MSKHLTAWALAALALGCNRVTESCTEIGCSDSLALHFIDADGQPVSGLSGTISLGSTTWTVDCLGTSDAEVTCDQGSIFIQTGGPGTEVVVDLQGDAASITTTSTVVWEEFAPNGVDCGPICDQAEATLTVDTPSG